MPLSAAATELELCCDMRIECDVEDAEIVRDIR